MRSTEKTCVTVKSTIQSKKEKAIMSTLHTQSINQPMKNNKLKINETLSRSNDRSVHLSNISLLSAGLYQCEVIADITEII